MPPERNEGQPRPFLYGPRKVIEEWRKLPRQIKQTPANLYYSLIPTPSRLNELREIISYSYNEFKNSCHKRVH